MNLEDKGFALQASFKFGPGFSHMLNIRGDDPQTFAENCQMAEQLISNLTQLGELFNPSTPPTEAEAISEIQNQLGGQVIGKTCSHGPMAFKEGFNQTKQKAWKAWMCQSNGRDKCAPIWM